MAIAICSVNAYSGLGGTLARLYQCLNYISQNTFLKISNLGSLEVMDISGDQNHNYN